jgi:hypothetical protein
MAIKVKVKVPVFNNLKKKLSSKDVQRTVAEAVIGEMRNFIAIGASPVRGERRFLSYKNKRKYPGDLKNSKPVNLELSGSMLDAITYKAIRFGVKIGIFRGIFSNKQSKKAITHIRGLNGVPKRKFFPIDEGDRFNVSIQKTIRTLYEKIISDIIKQ